MKYFKNTDLVKLYNVSEKTVRNWIDAAHKNKVDIDLYATGDRTYIADTIRNSAILPRLVVQGRKFRNQRSHRQIKPVNDFYGIFSDAEILDIICELEAHHELPLKYRYFEKGGLYWEKYLNKLHDAGIGNLLTNTIEAMRIAIPYIESITSTYDHINIVNLCVGDSSGAQDIVEHFARKGKLKKVINLDLSPIMMEVSQRNIKSWDLHGAVVEAHRIDITRTTFSHLTMRDSYGEDAGNTINIHLLLAGPLVNFRDPNFVLKLISGSLGKDDLLIATLKRDTFETRRFFDFNIDSDKKLLNGHDNFLLELLNIDESCYEHEQFFDERNMVRKAQIKLKMDLSIDFEFTRYKKTVHLHKGDTIQLWRSWHHSDQDITRLFGSAQLSIEHFSRSTDNQLMMIIGKIDQWTS